MTTQQTVVLEAAAQEFSDATSHPPFIYQLAPDKAREVLEDVQRSPVDKPQVDIEDTTIPGGPHGQIAVRLIKPAGATGTLPVVLYVHGAGWVAGQPGYPRPARAQPRRRRPAQPSCSRTTDAHPKRNTRHRSRRPTPPRNGSSSTGRNTASTRATSRSPATRSAGT